MARSGKTFLRLLYLNEGLGIEAERAMSLAVKGLVERKVGMFEELNASVGNGCVWADFPHEQMGLYLTYSVP